MLESAVQGVHVYSAVSLKLLVFIAIMYVDDTDILLTDVSGSDTLDTIFKRAQKAVLVWQQAVYDSGGAVRPEKCYWAAVDFRFKAGKWRYMKKNEFDGEITVKDTNMVRQRVKRYDINMSNEGLGIYVNPDGTMTLQLKEVIEKVTIWNDRVGASYLTKKEAYIGATTTIFNTVEYSLPGTSYSDNECRRIERALYRKLLGKLGVSSKFPLEYRYGPYKFQGAALLEISVAQVIAKLLIFLHQANSSSQLGTTFLVSLEAIQIEIGSVVQFFSLPYCDFGMLTPSSWLQQLWRSLSMYSIKLTKMNSMIPLPRENDVALMDAVIQAKIFSREEVECINRCRLYMKVFFLSDIVSGNGKLILQEAYDGRELSDRTSRWQWLRQPRPPKKHWLLWDIALREVWARTETRCLA